MKRNLLLLACLCVALTIFAQSSNTLSGVVVDEKGDAVESAVVSWLALPDSTHIINGVTDAAGRFSLVAPKSVPDSSVAVVSCIGYARLVAAVAAGNSNGLRFVLTEISHHLQGVTVTAKSTIKGVPGGYSFTPGGADLLLPDGNELLKNVPMLSGEEGSYKLLGKQNAKIYLNGRDPYMDSSMLKDLLANVKPADIERVELIFNPGSSRSGSDTDGIVNIVLKRRPDFGFRGSAYWGANVENSHVGNRGDFGLSYSHGRLRAIGTFTLRMTNSYSKSDVEYNFFDTKVNTSNISVLKEKEYKPRFGVLLSYDLSQKSTIGLRIMEDLTFSKNTDFTHTKSTDAANVVSEISTNRIYRTPSGAKTDATLFYCLMTDKLGGGLDVSLNYTNNHAPTRDTVTYIGTGQAVEAYAPFVQNTGSSINAWQAEAKYKKNFPDGSDLSFGAQWNLSRTDQDFLHADWKNGAFVRDDGQSNHFVYDEMVSAVFVNYNRQWNKVFSSTLGLRGEHTHTCADQRTTNEVFRNNYYNILPNVGLSFSMAGSKHIIELDYAPWLSRPLYAFLNPFKVWTSANTYQIGNPELRANFSHSGEVRYTLLGKYTLSLWGSTSSHSFADFTTSDGQNNTVKSYIMYGRERFFDVRLTGNQSFFRGRLRLFAFVDVNYCNYDASVQAVKSSRHAWKLVTMESVTGYLEKDYTSGISVFYMWSGRQVQPQRVDAPSHSLTVSIWKDFKWNGKLQLSFDTNMPSSFKQSYDMPDYHYASRMLTSTTKLSVSYFQRFGKKKVRDAKGHSGNAFSGRM